MRAGTLPVSALLGRLGDSPAALLLRFDLPPDVDVVDAYLLVDRLDGKRGTGVELHVARVGAAWSSAETTWVAAPELSDARGVSFRVDASGGRTLRIPMDPMAWRTGSLGGVALLVDHATPEGVSVALASSVALPATGDDGAEPGAREPRLELYTR